MQIGTALFLLATGAILRYAVDDALEGVDLATAGLILMIVGAVGLVLALFLMSQRDSETVVRERRDPHYDPPPR